MKKKILFFLLLLIISVIVAMKFIKLNKSGSGHGTFLKYDISESLKQQMIKGKMWHEGCPVAIDRLKLLRLSYIDFAGNNKHDGQMIVLDSVADNVLDIFRELYQNKFPIAKIRLPSEYNGDDNKSMEDNNTSSFMCRKISDENSEWSNHAYGLAIDINPIQNPYIDSEFYSNKTHVQINPNQGINYLNRANLRPGMVENIVNEESKETVIDIFYKHNFSVWGGKWNHPIDWHHFQINDELKNSYLNN